MNKLNILMINGICLLMIIAGCKTNSEISGEINKKDDFIVGVEYFNGWWKKSPNHWELKGKDWRPQYPDRVPLLGENSNQETMDREIAAASEHGIDFFSILWYFPGNIKGVNNVKKLNAGLDFFMESKNSDKMKFMVELCNHSPFSIETGEDWEKCMDVSIQAMKHPSYLRIDGRAIIKIHGGHQFYKDSGKDIERCRQILKRFRQKAKEEGVGELLIALGTYRENNVGENHHFSKIEEVDLTMQYMSSPVENELPPKEEDYPYEDLIIWAEQIRDLRRNDSMNWVPYFPAGWNTRPWRADRASYSFPDRDQWKKGLEELKEDILNTPNFGFPKKDGTTQKAFTIYAWNEFGEGGILAPTIGDQYMKLEVVKEVFGN